MIEELLIPNSYNVILETIIRKKLLKLKLPTINIGITGRGYYNKGCFFNINEPIVLFDNSLYFKNNIISTSKSELMDLKIMYDAINDKKKQELFKEIINILNAYSQACASYQKLKKDIKTITDIERKQQEIFDYIDKVNKLID